MAKCADMVEDYQMLQAISYNIFLITRPDSFINQPMKVLFTTSQVKNLIRDDCGRWVMHVFAGDFTALSGDAINDVQHLSSARCCVTATKTPPDCFLDCSQLNQAEKEICERRPAAKANFIFMRFFREEG